MSCQKPAIRMMLFLQTVDRCPWSPFVQRKKRHFRGAKDDYGSTYKNGLAKIDEPVQGILILLHHQSMTFAASAKGLLISTELLHYLPNF